MAVNVIKGYDVGLYLGTILVGCADDISLDVSVAEDETSCRATTGNSRVKTYEPGAVDITASVSGVTRVATGTDAATNVTAENILDGTLAGTKYEFRFSVGAGTGAVRYTAPGFFTKATISGAQEGNGTFSASARLTDTPVKTIAP